MKSYAVLISCHGQYLVNGRCLHVYKTKDVESFYLHSNSFVCM